jgi:hypothetical protein
MLKRVFQNLESRKEDERIHSQRIESEPMAGRI